MAEMIAVVTGGSDGIGKALVLKLGQLGYAVATIGRTASKTELLREEFRKLTRTDLLAETGDLINEAELNNFTKSVQGRFPHVDVLVNNAGFQIANDLLENANITAVEQMFKIHAVVPLQLYKAFFPQMKKRGSGRIINIVSVVVHNYLKETYGPYTITKYAEYGLAKMMLKEASKSNIKITNVILGGANTNLRKERRPGYLEPNDIAEVIGNIIQSPETVFIPEIQMYPQAQLV